MAVLADRAAEPVTETPARPAGARRFHPAPVLLGVLALAVLVVCGMFGTAAVRGLLTEHGRTSALAAGGQMAVYLTTFDHDSAESDVRRLEALTTAEFAKGFAGDRAAFLATLGEEKIAMAGTVRSSGVQSYDGSTATVLAAVRAEVTTAKAPTPQARDYRLKLSLVHQDGRWLTSAVEFVS